MGTVWRWSLLVPTWLRTSSYQQMYFVWGMKSSSVNRGYTDLTLALSLYWLWQHVHSYRFLFSYSPNFNLITFQVKCVLNLHTDMCHEMNSSPSFSQSKSYLSMISSASVLCHTANVRAGLIASKYRASTADSTDTSENILMSSKPLLSLLSAIIC